MKDVQFCPKCLSLNIQISEQLRIGDPFKKMGLVGWECLDCGYSGKDFFLISVDNYMKLKHGYTDKNNKNIKFSELVKEDNPTYFLEPDWGFPKGRRNYKGNESDLDCAKREIKEETGINHNSYNLKPSYYVTEVHDGTNDIKYAHRYYLGQCQTNTRCYIDPFNKHQAGEIRKIGWFTVEQVLAIIRPYHHEKKKVLLRVHKEIAGKILNFDGEEIDFNPDRGYRLKYHYDKSNFRSDKILHSSNQIDDQTHNLNKTLELNKSLEEENNDKS